MGEAPSFEELKARTGNLLAPFVAQDWPNLAVERAEGAYVFGHNGKKYLDFLSGFGACNTGHNHSRVVAAARRQMELMVHAPMGVFTYEPLLRLAWELGRITPGGIDMFSFGNSGAEAVEAAIKLARHFTGRPGIIAFLGGFHGRTTGAAALTSSKVGYRAGHGPFLPDVFFARFPDPYRAGGPAASMAEALGDVERLFEHVVVPEEVAAMVLEPIQGEGGYVIPPPGFLQALRRICDRHGILLILDEVQTGFGRTGEWFAARVLEVEPDIVCMAKAIASGFPLGAAAARGDIMGAWGTASHGTTFGGNPISCAAALATLEVIREEGLLENARSQGIRVLEALESLKTESPIVGDVRGIGLMAAVEFVVPGTDRTPNTAAVRRILERALADGLILYPCGHWTQTIRVIPPLTINAEQIDQGLEILRRAVLAEKG